MAIGRSNKKQKKKQESEQHSSNKWEGILGNKLGPGGIILGLCNTDDLFILKSLSKTAHKTIEPEFDLRILKMLRDFALNSWLQNKRKKQLEKNGAHTIDSQGYSFALTVSSDHGIRGMHETSICIARRALKPSEYNYPNPKQVNEIFNDTTITIKERIANLANLLALPLQCDLEKIKKDDKYDLLEKEPYCLLFSPWIVFNPLVDEFLREALKEIVNDLSFRIKKRIISLCRNSKNNDANVEKIKDEIQSLACSHDNLPGQSYQFMCINQGRFQMDYPNPIDNYCSLISINAEVLQFILNLGRVRLDRSLIRAIQSGHLSLVKHTIAAIGNDVVSRITTLNPSHTIQNITCLMVAAMEGQLEIMDEILNYDEDINAIDTNHWTALMYAADEGHDDCVRRLVLDCKADPTLKNLDKYNALDLAKNKGHNDIIKFLRENVSPPLQEYSLMNDAAQSTSNFFRSWSRLIGF